MKDLSKNVLLMCPLCGNDQFESLDVSHAELMDADSGARVKCSDCGSIFTKEELLAENAENISFAVEEVKREAIKEIEKELKRVLKKIKL